MAQRVVDPTVFIAAGAIIDWASSPGTHNAKMARHNADVRGLQSTAVVELRWAFDAALGYPSGPFTVWRRPHSRPDSEVKFTQTGSSYFLSGSWDCVYVKIASGPGGLAIGWSGAVFAGAVVAMTLVTPGATLLRIAGPGIRCVTLPIGTAVDSILSFSSLAEDPSWQRLEIVGLPGDGRAAHKTDLTAPQGMVSAPTSPEHAALDRFNRGAPLCGWPDTLPSGDTVPPWTLANPVAMTKLFQTEMLDDFIDMVDNSASSLDQQTKTYKRSLLTPKGQSADAEFNPLKLLLYGGVSDPLAALILGLGTAYPVERTQSIAFVASIADYMITGTFVSPTGRKVERAAFVLAPGPVLPPPTPASMAAASAGVLAPEPLDGPYRPVVSVSWDAPPPLFSFFVGSHAFARRASQPTAAPVMLLDPRPTDTALQPRGASQNPDHPLRRTMTDDSWPIDSAVTPNQLQYAVASQNIFGLWSAWNETPVPVQEPPAGPVTVTGARLDVPVGPAPCQATIKADLTWNWSSRSPETITVTGRRFHQTSPTDLPSDTTPPTADSFNATGAGTLATITFQLDGSIQSVDAGSGLTATVQHLTIDGQQISAVPITQRDARRYRVTISGTTLDFDVSARWGVALWAHGKEHRPPHRTGPWNTQPVVASAADPRPPVLTKTYDQFILASTRDSNGSHHANLEWNTAAGAVAYQVYTCSESTFRAFHNLAEPLPADTLEQRLTQLRDTFEANPERRPFTRVGTKPITGNSAPVTLPRGTKELHLYLVLGVSAGNVESAWPAVGDAQLRNRFVAFAAPQTVAPGAPQLEVARDLDQSTSPPTYRAKLRIRTAAGAQVSKVDLFRVRVSNAATQVETMGPPVYSITGTGGSFSVAPTPPGDPADPTQVGVGQTIGTITGFDAVSGSWKPVFYRAVAWGTDDPARGQYGVRSAASVVRQVVVPPADPPDVASPTVVLPISGSANARIDFGTAAPVADTVLGPHLLEAEVLSIDAAGATTPIPLSPGSAALSALPTSVPGGGVSGLWRETTSAGTTPLHLLVRRSDSAASLRVRLRITDPIGRITEKVLDVPPGVGGLVPDIRTPVVTKPVGGWVLSFTTSAPDTVGGEDVQLKVELKPSTLGTRTARLSSPLRSLPTPPRTRFNPFADPRQPIVVYATRRTHGLRDIGVCVRTAGRLSVSLEAPGGQSASIVREIR